MSGVVARLRQGLLRTVAGVRRAVPAPVNRALDGVVRALPEPLVLALNPGQLRYAKADIPVPPPAPRTPVRLYVAPANFAGQGFRWARAAERLPGVGAVSMAFERPQDFRFPVDDAVPVAVYATSLRWQRRQRTHVDGFSHVVIEAGRPLFGARSDAFDEALALHARGSGVALLFHGSDIRLPSRHADATPWSPFADWDLAPRLAEGATRNAAGVARVRTHAPNVPVFVSTPDLLLDVPDATWLPVVVDPEAWRSEVPPLARAVPVVVHAPSNPVVKGSDLIAPTLERLHAEGVVEYRRIAGVPAAQMPALYRDADVVLDQFRIGNYGVAACEAMAAGRLVVSHVTAQVRDHVRASSGKDLPVVEATPDTIEAVLRDVVARRDHYVAVAQAGPGFVADLHDGATSARVLAPFLGVEPHLGG